MADTTGIRWNEVKVADRHGTDGFGQSSDGTGADGHGSKYSSGTVTDNGNVDSYAADTGTANAYAVSLTPNPTLAAGDEIRLKVAHANTGASTLAVNGGSTIAIKKESATGLVDLGSSDWRVGQIVGVVYDGTVWQWASGGSGLSGSGTRGVLVSEVPVGLLNGINVTFSLTFTPFANSLILFLNGVEQTPVDVTLAANIITMTVAPKARDTGYWIARYEH